MILAVAGEVWAAGAGIAVAMVSGGFQIADRVRADRVNRATATAAQEAQTKAATAETQARDSATAITGLLAHVAALQEDNNRLRNATHDCESRCDEVLAENRALRDEVHELRIEVDDLRGRPHEH